MYMYLHKKSTRNLGFKFFGPRQINPQLSLRCCLVKLRSAFITVFCLIELRRIFQKIYSIQSVVNGFPKFIV